MGRGQGSVRGDRAGVGALTDIDHTEGTIPAVEPEFVNIIPNLALSRADFYKEHYTVSGEQLTSYAKWLNSSLLAINGAAVISVLNSYDKINNHAKISGFFIAGMIFSLLSGWFLQFVYLKSNEAYGNYWIFWSDSAANGWFEKGAGLSLEEKLTKSYRFKNFPPALGWASGISFIIGVTLFVLNLKTNT